jgi:signal transduction histidine kinase
VHVRQDGIGRYSRDVESTVYFCVLEALQNTAKYASASGATVALSQQNGTLSFEVADDGVGFDPGSGTGMGLTNMRDRIDAVSGDLELDSSPGAGTVVRGSVPAHATAGS